MSQDLSVQIERRLISYCCQNQNSFLEISSKIFEDFFTEENNRSIWSAMNELSSKAIEIDELMLMSQVNTNGKTTEISKKLIPALFAKDIRNIEIEPYIEQIREAYLMRKTIDMRSEIAEISKSPKSKFKDVVKILDKYVYLSNMVTVQNNTQSLQNISKNLNIEEQKALMLGEEFKREIPFYFSEIDKGYKNKPGNYILIAARPAMGKTSFALEAMWRQAKNGCRIFFASIEMSKEEINDKLISMEFQISNMQWTNMNEPQREKYRLKFIKLLNKHKIDIVVSDTIDTVEELIRRVRIEDEKKKIQFLYVDYIQLLGTEAKFSAENTNGSVAYISKSILQRVLKPLKIRGVILSQLNRAVENRAVNPKCIPSMVHLRDSGALEQDAYAVMFVYRAEYYNFKEDATSKSPEGTANIIFGKNRGGSTPVIRMKFIGEYTRFLGMDENLKQKGDNLKNLKVFIINGIANSGKDTFIEFVENNPINRAIIENISSVDPIKEFLRQSIGSCFNTKENDSDRQLITDIEIALFNNDRYKNYVLKNVVDKIIYSNLKNCGNVCAFVHVRRKIAIKTMVDLFGANNIDVKTIYINRPQIDVPVCSADIDASIVKNIDYDIEIINDSIGNLRIAAIEFIKREGLNE